MQISRTGSAHSKRLDGLGGGRDVQAAAGDCQIRVGRERVGCTGGEPAAADGRGTAIGVRAAHGQRAVARLGQGAAAGNRAGKRQRGAGLDRAAVDRQRNRFGGRAGQRGVSIEKRAAIQRQRTAAQGEQSGIVDAELARADGEVRRVGRIGNPQHAGAGLDERMAVAGVGVMSQEDPRIEIDADGGRPGGDVDRHGRGGVCHHRGIGTEQGCRRAAGVGGDALEMEPEAVARRGIECPAGHYQRRAGQVEGPVGRDKGPAEEADGPDTVLQVFHLSDVQDSAAVDGHRLKIRQRPVEPRNSVPALTKVPPP